MAYRTSPENWRSFEDGDLGVRVPHSPPTAGSLRRAERRARWRLYLDWTVYQIELHEPILPDQNPMVPWLLGIAVVVAILWRFT